MLFARGGELKQSYIVVYDVLDDGAVNIQSCEAYDGDLPEDGIWIQVCSTKADVDMEVPDAVIQQSIETYLKSIQL